MLHVLSLGTCIRIFQHELIGSKVLPTSRKLARAAQLPRCREPISGDKAFRETSSPALCNERQRPLRMMALHLRTWKVLNIPDGSSFLRSEITCSSDAHAEHVTSKPQRASAPSDNSPTTVVVKPAPLTQHAQLNLQAASTRGKQRTLQNLKL